MYRRHYGMSITENFVDTGSGSTGQPGLPVKTAINVALDSEIGNIVSSVERRVDKTLLHFISNVFKDEEVQSALTISLTDWVDDFSTNRFGTNEELKSMIVDIGSRIVYKAVSDGLREIFGPISENYTNFKPQRRSRFDAAVGAGTANISVSVDTALTRFLPNIKKTLITSINESKPQLKQILTKVADNMMDKRVYPLIDTAEDTAVEAVNAAIKDMSNKIKRDVLKMIGYYEAEDVAYDVGDEVKAQLTKAGSELEKTGVNIHKGIQDAADWAEVAGRAGIKGLTKFGSTLGSTGSKAAKSIGGTARSVGRSIKKFFSDPRLKYDINFVGKSPSGINIYTYKLRDYMGQSYPGVYKGVLSDEVPWATFTDENGYEMVDYDKIDVTFQQII